MTIYSSPTVHATTSHNKMAAPTRLRHLDSRRPQEMEPPVPPKSVRRSKARCWRARLNDESSPPFKMASPASFCPGERSSSSLFVASAFGHVWCAVERGICDANVSVLRSTAHPTPREKTTSVRILPAPHTHHPRREKCALGRRIDSFYCDSSGSVH